MRTCMNMVLAIILGIMSAMSVSGKTTTITGDYTISKSYSIAAGDTLIVKGNLLIDKDLQINSKSYLVVQKNVSINTTGRVVFNGGALSVKGNMTQNNGGKIIVNRGKTGDILVSGTFYDYANGNHPWTISYDYIWLIIGSYYEYSFEVDDGFTFKVNSYENSDTNSGSGWGINNKQEALNKLLDELKEHGFDYDEETLKEVIQEISSLLPITLTEFKVRKTYEGFAFTWQTASEINNEYFTIEYSQNGVDFDAIATIEGAGTTSETSNYSYEWTSDTEGTCYFRLKQTDFTGNFSYSNTISGTFVKTNKAKLYYQNGQIMYKGSPLRL